MARLAVDGHRTHEPVRGPSGQVGIPDSAARSTLTGGGAAGLWLSLLAGALAGYLQVGQARPATALTLLCALAFVGGLLSTWSPCGYSSVSLLRPVGRYSPRSVLGWLPTLATHALGYLAGALVLGGALGLLAAALPMNGFAAWALTALGVVALAYGLHQFKLIRMPYPQRCAQVPHDARYRFAMWKTGLLYGFALGLNFLTYVRTPILYVVVLAAVLSGSVGAALALYLALNAGRFLPLLINLFPVHDWAVHRWLARHEHNAVRADAVVLSFSGAMLLMLGLA